MCESGKINTVCRLCRLAAVTAVTLARQGFPEIRTPYLRIMGACFTHATDVKKNIVLPTDCDTLLAAIDMGVCWRRKP